MGLGMTRDVTVLVAEDEYLVALDVTATLVSAGYCAVVANTCERGLELVQSELLHAAVVDVMLQDAECEELAAALSASHVPVVYYTALPDAPLIRDWPGLVLPKPARPEVIVACLDRALNGTVH